MPKKLRRARSESKKAAPHSAGRSRGRTAAPASAPVIEKVYTALVCGDGRILPITESVGRRVLREIDPDSREGHALLRSGRVTLWTDDGQTPRRVPADQVLREMAAHLDDRLAERPRDRALAEHVHAVTRLITRSRRHLMH